VDLSIYNAKGQKVSTLHHGLTEKGNYSYVWDGRDVSGKATTTGVYFYRLSSGDKTITRKMVMMK
jgi:flagellar hook assembly protein FlgD